MPSVLATTTQGPLQFIFALIAKVGAWILIVAPFLILLGYITSAVLYVFAGHNTKLVDAAKDLFIRTSIATGVIAGYFTIKALILSFATAGF